MHCDKALLQLASKCPAYGREHVLIAYKVRLICMHMQVHVYISGRVNAMTTFINEGHIYTSVATVTLLNPYTLPSSVSKDPPICP